MKRERTGKNGVNRLTDGGFPTCGTRTGYIGGCRCERCRAAQAAYAWAARKVSDGEWPQSIKESLSAEDVCTDGFGMIEGRVIIEAIAARSSEIKTNVFARVWAQIKGWIIDGAGSFLYQSNDKHETEGGDE